MEQGTEGSEQPQDVPSSSPENYTPAFLMTGFNVAVTTIETYGWVLLIIVLGVLYLINKYKPSYEKWKQHKEDLREAEKNKKNPDEAYAIQVSMEQSRLRMQERVKIDAEKKRIKEKEMVEEKRLLKIEEWEKHQQGRGYHSKSKPKETTSTEQQNGQLKPKRKNQFKSSDFNPLTGSGGSGSSGYRPSRRNGGGGG